MSATALQIFGSIVSGLAQVRSAQAEGVQYEMKARNEEIKGRIDAVNYKMKGTEILRNMEKAMERTSNPQLLKAQGFKGVQKIMAKM